MYVPFADAKCKVLVKGSKNEAGNAGVSASVPVTSEFSALGALGTITAVNGELSSSCREESFSCRYTDTVMTPE